MGVVITVNQDNADYGLQKLRSAKSLISATKDEVGRQANLIPELQGEKDPLGERVEEAINEIKQDIDDLFLSDIDKVLGQSSKIKEKATEMDEELEREYTQNLMKQKAKVENTDEETDTSTTSTTANNKKNGSLRKNYVAQELY